MKVWLKLLYDLDLFASGDTQVLRAEEVRVRGVKRMAQPPNTPCSLLLCGHNAANPEEEQNLTFHLRLRLKQSVTWTGECTRQLCLAFLLLSFASYDFS